MNKTLICVFFALFCAQTMALTSEDTIEVIAGLIDAIIQKNDIVALEKCLTDVDDMGV